MDGSLDSIIPDGIVFALFISRSRKILFAINLQKNRLKGVKIKSISVKKCPVCVNRLNGNHSIKYDNDLGKSLEKKITKY